MLNASIMIQDNSKLSFNVLKLIQKDSKMMLNASIMIQDDSKLSLNALKLIQKDLKIMLNASILNQDDSKFIQKKYFLTVFFYFYPF